jgi:CMP/dCMP kinase
MIDFVPEENPMSLVVAIDGPAGAGKSTIARKVAQKTGLTLVDTGAIYRTLSLASQRRGVGAMDELGLASLAANMNIRFAHQGAENVVFLDDEDVSKEIRSQEIAKLASMVSRHKQVRAALLSLQQTLGTREPGSVLEGRDIGTVVFPNAEVKIFLTASPEERARRRASELLERGEALPYDTVLDEIRERDRLDTERPVAPLRQANDASLVDSTDLTEYEVVQRIVRLIQEALAVKNLSS